MYVTILMTAGLQMHDEYFCILNVLTATVSQRGMSVMPCGIVLEDGMKYIVQIDRVMVNLNVIIHPYAYQKKAFVMAYLTVLFLTMTHSVVCQFVLYTVSVYYTV